MATYNTSIENAQKLVEVQIGKVKLPVASVSAMFTKDSAKDKIEGYIGSYLINFKAYDPRNKERIMDAFEGGELAEADIQGMTFTHEILVTERNPNPVLPCKGDTIEANIAFAEKDGEYVLDKAGNRIMNVTTYQVPKAVELKSSLFAKKTATVEIHAPAESATVTAEKSAF